MDAGSVNAIASWVIRLENDTALFLGIVGNLLEPKSIRSVYYTCVTLCILFFRYNIIFPPFGALKQTRHVEHVMHTSSHKKTGL